MGAGVAPIVTAHLSHPSHLFLPPPPPPHHLPYRDGLSTDFRFIHRGYVDAFIMSECLISSCYLLSGVCLIFISTRNIV